MTKKTEIESQDFAFAPLDAPAIEAVRALAVAATSPVTVTVSTDGLGGGLPAKVPVAWDRNNPSMLSVNNLIEQYRYAPARREGTATVETLASFINLVNRHRDGQSAIFGCCRWPEPKLVAVLDYDDVGSPARFGRHRIEYAFPVTDELKAWVGCNAQPMEQDVFAAFIEEHAAELAAPEDGERSTYEPLFKEHFATPSEVLELSRHLEVLVNAKAKQGIRLQTGERQIEFSEEHVNAKGESVVIPGIFIVSVPAFIDGDAVRIPARLRYRISGGGIKWFYQLYRWETFLREQVQHDLRDAAEKTALPAFEGVSEKQ